MPFNFSNKNIKKSIEFYSKILKKLLDFENRNVLTQEERSDLNSNEEVIDIINSFGRFVGIRFRLNEHSSNSTKFIDAFAFISMVNICLALVGYVIEASHTRQDFLQLLIVGKFNL